MRFTLTFVARDCKTNIVKDWRCVHIPWTMMAMTVQTVNRRSKVKYENVPGWFPNRNPILDP